MGGWRKGPNHRGNVEAVVTWTGGGSSREFARSEEHFQRKIWLFLGLQSATRRKEDSLGRLKFYERTKGTLLARNVGGGCRAAKQDQKEGETPQQERENCVDLGGCKRGGAGGFV